jgi:hypothetical protein
MTETIASDKILTDEQRRNLQLIADMIIPANAERGLPSAGELDLLAYLTEFATNSIPLIQTELESLNEEASKLHRVGFNELGDNERQKLVDDMRASQELFAQNIIIQTLACYYQDEQVLEALGMEARPPFPKGNEVVSGDLSLLDPVRQRAKLYRE